MKSAALKSLFIALVVCSTAGSAVAQEPVGCDKFKWPLDKERATLNGSDLPKLASGAKVTFPIPFGTIVTLKPFAQAQLPAAPERAPKSPASFAGFLQVQAPAKAATYKITLSSEGWIDVIQNGETVKSAAFSGATGCEGVRKSVKFDLAAAPFTLELSGVPADSIKLAVSND